MEIQIIVRKPKFTITQSKRHGTYAKVSPAERSRLIDEARAANPQVTNAAAIEIDYGFATGTRITFTTDETKEFGL